VSIINGLLIVANHNGKISAYILLGTGTTFVVETTVTGFVEKVVNGGQ
jgi:hypothetical protein